MILLDVDAIEARAKAATPGPWLVNENDSEKRHIDGPSFDGRGYGLLAAAFDDEDDPNRESQVAADASFIAHAREDVPALVAEVKRLRENRASDFIEMLRILAPHVNLDFEEDFDVWLDQPNDFPFTECHNCLGDISTPRKWIEHVCKDGEE